MGNYLLVGANYLLQELRIEEESKLNFSMMQRVEERGYQWKDDCLGAPHPRAVLRRDAYARFNDIQKSICLSA